MGKWKRMGKNYNKDVMICPNCKEIFMQRAKEKVCPLCKIRLVYLGEYFSPMSNGFYWCEREWKKISDLGVGERYYFRNK